MQKKITLKDIADNLYISVSDYSHSFKRFMKESIFEYSLYLLQNRDFSIMQVALKIGFNSSSYYSKLLKKYMKMTPKE